MAATTEAKGKVLLSADQIQKRVKELGAQITADYQARTCSVVGVLENGFMFMADLVRAIDVPVLVHFIKPFYDEHKNGPIDITYSPTIDIKGQHVLLVEGLVQSGITSDYLIHSLISQGAASVKLAALLDKSSARRVALRPDYFGFILNESYVTGYGLGSPHLGRNLPYIQSLAGSPMAGSAEETVR